MRRGLIQLEILKSLPKFETALNWNRYFAFTATRFKFFKYGLRIHKWRERMNPVNEVELFRGTPCSLTTVITRKK